VQTGIESACSYIYIGAFPSFAQSSVTQLLGIAVGVTGEAVGQRVTRSGAREGESGRLVTIGEAVELLNAEDVESGLHGVGVQLLRNVIPPG
jgi:hypothetical protein